MNDRKKRWGRLIPAAVVFAAFHFYFFFFIQNRRTGYLVYLDLLLLIPAFGWLVMDYRSFRKRELLKQELLEQEVLACRMMGNFVNQDIAEHDVKVLERQLNKRFEETCDLQDYVAKWCHEVKIPLAAALLIHEKIEDPDLKTAMREQLEKINLRLNSMLSGCRLQSSLLDLQIKKTDLRECVRTSIHNNQFFLIRKNFALTVEVEELTVYTDPAWLVYILDQLLSNAVKYGEKMPPGEDETPPFLAIWAVREEDVTWLYVEDHGQGIRDQDMGRIFEKGFTGSNYHNGRYKSTGMGLYLASKIAGRLGHEIRVESEYGSYARFCVILKANSYYSVS